MCCAVVQVDSSNLDDPVSLLPLGFMRTDGPIGAVSGNHEIQKPASGRIRRLLARACRSYPELYKAMGFFLSQSIGLLADQGRKPQAAAAIAAF